MYCLVSFLAGVITGITITELSTKKELETSRRYAKRMRDNCIQLIDKLNKVTERSKYEEINI